MKIITSFTLNWDLDVVDEQSHEYVGPVAECKGGGDQAYYENLNNLYGIQAHQAQVLGNVAEKDVLPAYQGFLQESKGYGSQANQEKNAAQAGADAQAATGAQRAGMSADMASMGINPTDSRYQGAMSKMGTDASAQQAAAESGAREGTRRQGMAMEQDAVSLGMGTPTMASQAAAGAGQSANAAGNLYNQGRQANAQGIGSAVRGGMDLYGYLNQADGGYVHLKDGGYVDQRLHPRHMASGGVLGMKYGQINTPPPPPTNGGGQTTAGQYGQAASMGAKAAPMVGKGLKMGMQNFAPESNLSTANGVAGTDVAESAGTSQGLQSQYANTPNAGGYEQFQQWAADKINSIMPQVEGTGSSPVAEGAVTGTAEGAVDAAAPVAADAAATGAEAAAGTAATYAAGETAAEAAAAEVAPYALALIAAKDGGSIHGNQGIIPPHARNETGGQAVGPGGPKDDKIPVMLSDGEFVLPIGTVKKYGLAKLEKMRQEGLQFEQELGIRKPQPQMQGAR